MDIQPYGFEKYGVIDMDLKAEDLEDFMRQAFSHSKIDVPVADTRYARKPGHDRVE